MPLNSYLHRGTHRLKHRIIASFLLFFTLFQSAGSPLAYAIQLQPLVFDLNQEQQTSEAQTHLGIIAVLVEESLMDEPNDYPGLTADYSELATQKLSDRIVRYALDAQRSQEYTKATVIPVSSDEKVEDIAHSLEKLYFEGDGSANYVTKLAGVVLIGDVPMPVVNKNGNPLVSMLPYTDFEDKSYLFDISSGQYIPNQNSATLKADVWHGVIRPPVGGEEGKRLLADYFDKNHLFHNGHADFTQFSKKLFFMDLIREFEQMDKFAFQNYLRYLEHWEDLTYNRYNKHLLAKLLGESEEALKPGDGFDNDGDGLIDEDPVNGIDDDGDGEPGSPLHGIADGIDNDNDGEIDEPDEGRFGLCDIIPNVPNSIQDCSIPGVPLMTVGPCDGDMSDPNCTPGNYYNVKPGSKYFAADNVDNNGNGIIDEGIDEDDGDPFEGIDNDRDGLTDEDGLNDNDADGDGKIDEDGPGDANGDGCSGECGVDEDLDSYDFDSDGYPNGYEREYGSLTPGGDLPTDPENPVSVPLDFVASPIPFLRLAPIPDPSEWIDEEHPFDDDEDGLIDEDGIADNDNDGDGLFDEDPGATDPVDPESMASMPDAQTKPLIDQLAMSYDKLFEKFYSNVNDWATSTGRYNPNVTIDVGGDIIHKSEVANVPSYVTMKDEATRKFLKVVNDAVEKEINAIVNNPDNPQAAAQLQKPVLMLQGASIFPELTLSDDSEVSGESYDFINFGQSPQYTTILVNGQPADTLQSVQECSLYRGSQGLSSTSSILVEAHHLTNVFAEDLTNPFYAGCTALNIFSPERCFEDRAIFPLFDLLGAREVTSADANLDTPDACFDFKEENRYLDYRDEVDDYIDDLDDYDNEEAKNLVPKPGSPYLPPSQIVLYDGGGVTLTLADVAEKWGQVDGIDNNNNGFVDEYAEGAAVYGLDPENMQSIGAAVLRQDKTYVFDEPPLAFPGIKRLELDVDIQEAENQSNEPIYLTSFVAHDDPDAATLEANYTMDEFGELMPKTKVPQSIPMDNPRYFTFVDKLDRQQEVRYPNIFAAHSVEEARAILEQKEQQLMQIAQETSVNVPIEGRLTGLLDAAPDNVERLDDAYRWKSMNIDDKHVYVLETYLDPLNTAYVGDTAKGYESLYFVADGDADTFEMRFNADYPESEGDLEFLQAMNSEGPAPTQPGGEAATQSENQQQESEYFDGILIPQWFPEILQWVDETVSNVSTYSVAPACSISDAPGDYFDQLLEAGDLDGDGVPDDQDTNPRSGDSDGDGIPDGAENTSQLRLSASKPVMETGTNDVVTVTVEGLSTSGALQTSNSFTEVELVPGNEDLTTINSTNPVRLQNGRAQFQLYPTDESGTFTITSSATNQSGITSNTISLESTKRKIRLVSYEKNVGPQFDQAGSTGFIVLDDNDQIIAEVDGLTGLVDIRDDRFELLTLQSEGNKPVRLGIQEIATETIVASVFFVANEDDPIILDGETINYFDIFENLSGVHIKDLADDEFDIEMIADDAEFNSGGAYLTQSGQRFGIVDRLGNVFLTDDFELRMKETVSSLDPVVFEVRQGADRLFEIFIAADFPRIEILAEDGQYAEFNLIAAAWDGLLALVFGPRSAHAQDGEPESVAIPDTDGDGLSDLEELVLGLDPRNRDTDGDGFEDEEEILNNYDPAVAGQILFTDLTSDMQGFSDILELFRRGIIQRYEDGTFRPNDLLTREEFVRLNLGAVCVQCTNFDEKVKFAIDGLYNPDPFPDTNFSEELLYCVKHAKNEGIVSGYQGSPNTGYFLPQNPISRAEATKVILETAQEEFEGLTLADNVTAGKPWHYNYVISAQQLKLFPRGRFTQLDTLGPAEFKAWFDAEITNSNSQFIAWIEGDITRREFAIMVTQLTELFDCQANDEDGDGLPDNYERFISTTSVTNPDTDGGGVNDRDEVLRGSNPLFAGDDFPEVPEELGAFDSDGDGMPDEWELLHGLDPFDPSDANEDPDGDGLMNLDEYGYDTDPNDPDTDDGGVNDGDEIIRGIDPLDGSDDSMPAATDEGGFIVGDTVFDDYFFQQTSAGEEEDFLEYLDEMPADGSSRLFLKASILDEAGDVNESDSTSIIRFFAEEGTGEFATINPTNVVATAGEAETEITASTKAGIVSTSAEINGEFYPVDEREIYVTPLEPAEITVLPLSPVIRSGGLSTSTVHVEMLDMHGNLVNNDLTYLTLEVSGPGTVDQGLDEDPDMDGIQVSTITGDYDLVVTSTEETGNITVTASYFEAAENDVASDAEEAIQPEPLVTSAATIESRNDIQLVVTPETDTLPSDFASTSTLDLEVQDFNGSLVTNFQGTAKFQLLNAELGELLEDNEVPIVNGTASIAFRASNKAGDATIAATAEGFTPVNTTLTVAPKQAAQIVLEADSETMDSDPSELFEVRGRLYDADGNFAWNDSSTSVAVGLTQNSKLYAQFQGSSTVQVVDGEFSVLLRGKSLTGPVNLVANASGLVPGVLSLQAVKKFKATDFNETTPHVLFASILGSDFGNVFEENYLGGWFLFAQSDREVIDPNTSTTTIEKTLSKAQAAVSLLSKPKPFGRIMSILPGGQIQVLDSQRVGSSVIPNNGSDHPNRIVFRDLVEDEDLIEVSLLPSVQTRAVVTSGDENFARIEEGIHVQPIVESEAYELREHEEGVSFLKDGNEAIRIDHQGNITILNNDFSVQFDADNTQYLRLIITDRGSEVLNLVYAVALQSDLTVLQGDTPMNITESNFNPGMYARVLSSSKNIDTEISYSGNSTAMPKGIFLIDKSTELESSQAPGQSYPSLEKSDEIPGIGFTGNNKHMLLFSAGNSVGESNLPYASEIGVVLGDPTVRVDNKSSASNDTGFTKDLGQQIFAGDQPVKEMNIIDYNSDGLDDIFVLYESGEIRLLQNNEGYPKFEDKGIFLDFPNGVVSMASDDFDGDGQEDLVVATADSCREGEVCVSFYKNFGGNFVRTYLDLEPFDENNRIYMLKSFDLNKDSYPDLITSDDTGAVRVFYNFGGAFEQFGQLVGSLGISINPNNNLKTEVLVGYDGSPVNQDGPTDDTNFVTFAVPTNGTNVLPEQQEQLADINEAILNGGDLIEASGGTSPATAVKDFVYLDLDPALGLQSEKRAQDLTPPANVAARGDEIAYTLTLRNTSSQTLSNVMVSDVIPGNVELDESSITCNNCSNFEIVESGQSVHPFIFMIGDMAPGATRTLEYRAEVQSTPRVKITVGDDLNTGYTDDNFGDIGATPEGNPTGKMVYYYSTGIDPSSTKVLYDTWVTPDPVPPDPPEAASGIDLAQLPLDVNLDGVPDVVQNYQEEKGSVPITPESGLNAVQGGVAYLEAGLNELGEELDAIGDGLEAAIAAFTCTSGCIPMPINFAFLAPGAINVMGVPSGFDPGLPVFAWGVPSIVPTWPPSPYQGSAGGRIYMSPTLTASLATGICLGPYLAGQCWAFKITDLLPSDLCDEIAGSINGAIATAGAAAQAAGESVSALSSDGSVQGAADASGHTSTGGFEGSTSLGNYQYRASVQTNFRVPGFPAVLTNWLDRQTEEIINKLTDLPDIYFIYPDPTSLVGSFVPQDSANQSGTGTVKPAWEFPKAKEWESFREVLSYMNSIPLIQIQSQDILIKIPALTRREIEKVQRDAQQWVVDAKAEIERVKEIWTCDESSTQQTLCDKLLLDANELIKSVEKNIEILEKWKEFPRQLLAWRNILSKYAYALICYMDAIINYTGGYIHKQQTRIDAWIEMIRKVKETIANWRLLVDLTIEYQASCDKCSTARFTLMELILRLFAVIPSPPIIPFPKLPDIYLDLSQIQVGLKVLWPNVRFRPEPLIIPKIPRLRLPDLPSITVKLPGIPTLPEPPGLPELPDLPPLPLPTLPDIPPPPKVPEFPASIKAVISILKKIIRILCLIKKGLIPVSETLLKSQIEQLTERPLSPLLPIDLGLNFQLPAIEYDYVDRIEIIGILNFQLDFNPIFDTVKAIADDWNSIATDLVKVLNQTAQQASSTAEEFTQPDSPLPEENINVDLSGDIGTLTAIHPALGDATNALVQSFDALERDAVKYAQMAEDMEDIRLVATQRLLQEDDPLLNRSLSEIQASIASQPEPEFESQKNWVAMRNALLDYTTQQAPIDAMLESGGDLDTIGSMLAQTNTLDELVAGDNSLFVSGRLLAEEPRLASTEPVSNVTSNQPNTLKIVGSALTGYGQTVKDDLQEGLKLLADVSITDAPGTTGMEDPATANKGIFILNHEQQVNEKLLNYIDEADKESWIEFIDIDNDSDNDILFSYGGDIYLKKNHKVPNIPVLIGDQPQVVPLENFIPNEPVVNDFAASYSNNQEVELAWTASTDPDLSGYEITYKTSLDAFEQEGLGVTRRAGFVLEKEDLVNADGLIPENATLRPEEIFRSYAVAENIQGQIVVDGFARRLVVPESGAAVARPKEILHTLADSTVRVDEGGAREAEITLPKGVAFELPNSYTEEVSLDVVAGVVEVIDPESSVEEMSVVEGMMIDPGSTMKSVNGGTGTIRVADGGYLRVFAGEELYYDQLSSPTNPTASFTIPNGFYYARIQSFDTLGRRSIASSTALMAPSICADDQRPFPNAGAAEKEVPIFKPLEIDASGSFDTQGDILGYWIDTNLEVDSDGDGDPTNDKNLGNDLDVNSDFDGDGDPANDLDDPHFVLGPYENLDERRVKLNVVDEALNAAGQEITIRVYVPDISLDRSAAESGVISGSTDPGESEIPVSILRNRYGVIEKIVTDSADENGKYFTNESGEFRIEDLNLDDTLIIKNAAGEAIGEINPETGRIILFEEGYNIRVLPAEMPLLPTRIVVVDPNEDVILTLFLVPDINTDTTIDPSDFPYNEATVALFEGVHIKDLDLLDGFEFRRIPTDDVSWPGATEIVSTADDSRAALVDTGGNFYIFDERLSLRLRPATDLSDPLVIQVVFTDDGEAPVVIGEFYIAVNSGRGVEFVPADKFQLFVEGAGRGPLFDSDGDGMPDQWELKYSLDINDPNDAQLDPDNDGLTNLEEYRALSNPRNADTDGDGFTDAEELIYGRSPTRAADSPFADVTADHPYYDSIVNLNQRNILEGIPSGNQEFFGPEENMSRAEFSKIMLDTFCIIPRPAAYQGPSTFTDIPYERGNLPWYYPVVREANFQGFVTGYLGEINPVTGATPFRPDNPISKAEAVKVILEALEREQIIDLSSLETTIPWYNAYMEVAQDLTPYLVDDSSLQELFIVTAQEALNPSAPVTRAEFIAMADRVLTVYDCSLIDSDGDGMPDYWEEKYGFDPFDPSDADNDPDEDGLINLDEYRRGTDPRNPDTDGGGVNDGTEVEKATNPLNAIDDPIDTDGDGLTDRMENQLYNTDPFNPDTDGGGVSDGDEVLLLGTNPLNPRDDGDSDGDGLSDFDEINTYGTDPNDPDTDGGGVDDGTEVGRGTDPLFPADDLIDPRSDLEEGIYVIQEACLQCPCPSAIDHTADIIPGDQIFAVISNADDSEIFSKSNIVEITAIPEEDDS